MGVVCDRGMAAVVAGLGDIGVSVFVCSWRIVFVVSAAAVVVVAVVMDGICVGDGGLLPAGTQGGERRGFGVVHFRV